MLNLTISCCDWNCNASPLQVSSLFVSQVLLLTSKLDFGNIWLTVYWELESGLLCHKTTILLLTVYCRYSCFLEPKNTQADSPRKEEIITPTNKCKETICSPILPPLTSKHSSKQSQQSYTASTTMSSSKPPQLVMPPRVPPHPSSYVNFPPSSYTLRPPSYYYRY